MKVRISPEAKETGLIVGHLVIENLENKKNPNKKLEKILKELRDDVKNNPDRFLKRDEIRAYQDFIESTASVIKSNEVGPTILVNIILEKGFLAKFTLGAGQEGHKIPMAQLHFVSVLIGDGSKFQIYIVQLTKHLGGATGDLPAHG